MLSELELVTSMPNGAPADRLTVLPVLLHDRALVATVQASEVEEPPASRLTVTELDGDAGSPVVKE